MNELLTAALGYAERGWYVLPIDPNRISDSGKKGKLPYKGTRGVKDATTNPKIIKKLWKQHPEAQVAIDVGRSGFLIYDLDPGSSIKKLNETLNGNLPKTELESKTPRDGQHLFYKIDNTDIIPSSASKVAPHVDIRSDNGYVLLPPSTTEAGAYIWVKQGEAAYRTDAMVRTSYTGRTKSEDHDKWIIEQDIPENVKLAIEWITTEAKIAIQGEGGDQCTYDTGCMMKSYGLSQAKALEIMLDHWNGDCKPPWDYDELEVKVEHSYRYNTSQPGNVTPAYKVAKKKELFKPVTTILPAGNEWKSPDGYFRAVDREGSDDMKKPNWLLEDFIPENSYVMMYGAYSTFKSFIALDIALSIVTGGLSSQNLWGKVHHGNVGFAIGEGRGMFVKRMRAWEHYKIKGHKAEGIFLIDPVPKITDQLEPFIEVCKAASPEGYRLMVIDTVGRAMQGMNENAQENASAFTAMIGVMQKELHCSILALHHTGHEKATHARGSSVFGADADVIISLDRPDVKGYVVSLDMQKQKDFEAWEKKKHLLLKEIIISEELRSLVPVSHTPLKQADDNDKAISRLFLIKLTDNVIHETLKENPARAWTDKDLAIVVSTDDRMRGKAKHRAIIGYLEVIRETETGYISTRFYDSKGSKSAGKWGWKL